jgi:ATP-dependent RNA helicase DeaD
MSDSPALTSLTIKDLRQLAGEHNLPNRSKLGKEELIQALQAVLADRAATSLSTAIPETSAAADAGDAVPAPVAEPAAGPVAAAAPAVAAEAPAAAAEAPAQVALVAAAAQGGGGAITAAVLPGDEPEMITADSFKTPEGAAADEGDDDGEDEDGEGDEAAGDGGGEGAPGDAPPGERRRRRRRRRRGRGRREGEGGMPGGQGGDGRGEQGGEGRGEQGGHAGDGQRGDAVSRPAGERPQGAGAPVLNGGAPVLNGGAAAVGSAPGAAQGAPVGEGGRPALPAARLRGEPQPGGQPRDPRPQGPGQGRGDQRPRTDQVRNDGRGDPRDQGNRPPRPRLDGPQRPVPSVLDRLCSFSRGILELCDPSTPTWAQPRLAELLAEAGMVPLPNSGVPHPDFHLVVGTMASAVPAGHIAEVVAPGFALRGDRGDLFALRKSQVRVAEGARAPVSAPTTPTPTPAPVADGPEDLTAESAGGSAETETIPRESVSAAASAPVAEAGVVPAGAEAPVAEGAIAPRREDGPRRDDRGPRRDDRGPRRDDRGPRRDDRGPRRDDRPRDDRGRDERGRDERPRDERPRDERPARDDEGADAEPSAEAVEAVPAPASGRAPLRLHPREPAGDAPALPLAAQVPEELAARPKAEGFRPLGLNDQILADLAAMGYEQPTPIQAEAIPVALSGKDLLGQAQTGTGKTAAFVLPMLQQLYSLDRVGPVALVLCPTRELARQVHGEFTRMAGASGARAAIIYGGVPMDDQIRSLERKPHVVIGTPGRIIDHMRRKVLDLSRLALVVLDEADQMLDIGFWPDVNFIISHTPPARQVMLFSATFPDPVKEMAAKHMKEPVHVRIQPRQVTVEQVDQKYIAVPRERKNELLAHFIETQQPEQLVVFCRTKHQTDRVAEVMKRKNISAAAIHGDLPQSKREKTLQAFRSRELQCLIATNVAARGLDIPTVSHVVNYDIPEMPEEYVHRIGRTARNGARGVARTFITPEDGQFLLEIEKHIGLLLEEEVIEGFNHPPAAEIKRTIAELPAGAPRILKPLIGGIRLGRRR